jgi:hypothetical protein
MAIALWGARLKDSFMVDTEPRQLIEQGHVGRRPGVPRPYARPMPDAGGFNDHDGNAGHSRPGDRAAPRPPPR